MPYQGFQPEYILQSELSTFDLPSLTQLPNIMNIVDASSSLIDTYCGRVSSDGIGSLVYSEYAKNINS